MSGASASRRTADHTAGCSPKKRYAPHPTWTSIAITEAGHRVATTRSFGWATSYGPRAYRRLAAGNGLRQRTADHRRSGSPVVKSSAANQDFAAQSCSCPADSQALAEPVSDGPGELCG